MSSHQSSTSPILPGPLSQEKNGELGANRWKNTVPAPLDPLRASELLNGAAPVYERFALTMPMGLPAK